MSNQIAVFNGAQVPAAFHSLMSQMQQSELSQNVGANFAVVSFKGKVFRIKHGGTETPITIQFNGQEYAAPFYDVVIPLANAVLSKTYYGSGYTEGSDEAPTCWSEDGRTPLAPLENRPLTANGQRCTDCQLCPMNVFGSKINEATGAKGKACADTRKLVIVPTKVVGNAPDGTPITEVDTDNAKYGGPMLMRVPAASLQVFAEYDRKLQAMGVPYFAVVTRLQFDQTVAYPKFSLQPVRLVTEAEAQRIIELRNNPVMQHILGGAHAGAPAAPVPTAAPAQPAPVPTAAPVAPAAPATAAPVLPAGVVPAPAPVAAPAPVQTAPVPTLPAEPAPLPTAPMQAAPVQTFPGFEQAQPMPVQTAPAAQPSTPAAGVAVSPELLGRINQLLDT